MAPQLEQARTFLAERGVLPDTAGRYEENSLEAVLRALGWTLTWDGTAGDWVVEIGEELAPAQFQYAVAGGPDPADALLRALAIALTWRTDADAWRAFDAQTQELMRHSGEDDSRASERLAPALASGRSAAG